MEDVSFCYVVDGTEESYKNLVRSVKSVKNIDEKFKVVILEFGNKLSSSTNSIKIIQEKINSNSFIDNNSSNYELFVRMKRFEVFKYCTTTNGIFLECDSILISNCLEIIRKMAANSLAITKHHSITHTLHFLKVANVSESSKLLVSNREMLTRFPSSRAMWFNPQQHYQIFGHIMSVASRLNSNGFYDAPRPELTDLFLGLALSEIGGYTWMGGWFSHCGDPSTMPLKYSENGVLIGGHKSEDNLQPIFILRNRSPKPP